MKKENPLLFSGNYSSVNSTEQKIVKCLSDYYKYVNNEFADGTTLFEVKILQDKRKRLIERISEVKERLEGESEK